MALGTGNYAKKKNAITLSKALATFGFETWSSLDKGKIASFQVNSTQITFRIKLKIALIEIRFLRVFQLVKIEGIWQKLLSLKRMKIRAQVQFSNFLFNNLTLMQE